MNFTSITKNLIENPPFQPLMDGWECEKRGIECICGVLFFFDDYDSKEETKEEISDASNHAPTCPYHLAVEASQHITPAGLEGLGFENNWTDEHNETIEGYCLVVGKFFLEYWPFVNGVGYPCLFLNGVITRTPETIGELATLIELLGG